MNNRLSVSRHTACGVLALTACFIGMSPLANALEYYTWIDEHGITHLSEEPPENGVARRLHVDVPVAASRSLDPNADYYSIANQNQRMQANRREREKILAERRLELERLELQREQLALQAYQSELISQSNTVSAWRRDPGTAYAEYSYLSDYSGHRGKAGRRGHGYGRRHGEGYRSTRGHRHRNRNRNTVRSRSIGITRAARPAGPGSRF